MSLLFKVHKFLGYLLIPYVVLLSSCGFMSSNTRPLLNNNLHDTIFPVANMPSLISKASLKVSSLNDIAEGYRQALMFVKDTELRRDILVRLADVEMAKSENNLFEIDEQKDFFKVPIALYVQLLTQDVAGKVMLGPAKENILYQLAKAYSLSGEIEKAQHTLTLFSEAFPESPLMAEVNFRRAEFAFSNQNYKQAEILYTQTVKAGNQTAFYTNARYMVGWCLFKQSKYQQALPAFLAVLDSIIIQGRPLSEMSNSERNISLDSLKVMAIIYSGTRGAEAIKASFSEFGARHYEYLVYAKLADLYLGKERFTDSAETYMSFVDQYPNSEHSTAYNLKAVQIYRENQFPSLMLKTQEAFIEKFGVKSTYWHTLTIENKISLTPYIKFYLDQLSSHYHAKAQQVDQGKGNKVSVNKESSSFYLKASEYYEHYVIGFPNDINFVEKKFLLAETLMASGALEQAIEQYEWVAFKASDSIYAKDAGYAAILAIDELVHLQERKLILAPPKSNRAFSVAGLSAIEAKSSIWFEKKQLSVIQYAQTFPLEPRGHTQLTALAQSLFEKERLEEAIEIAKDISQWQVEIKPALTQTALLILGHSYFDLRHFSDAETAYQKLLSVMSLDNPIRKNVQIRMASSLYKQAELAREAGKNDNVIDFFIRARDAAPGSDVAIKAHYDLIAYLINLERWEKAEFELDSFKRLYATHALSKTLLPKYVEVYQRSEKWQKAASALSDFANVSEGEVKRNAIYLSAELYERAQAFDLARMQYKNYVIHYTQPFNINIEAKSKLVDLNIQSKNIKQQEYWMKEIIQANEKAGNQATARSRTLAVKSMSYFANKDYLVFKSIPLSLPIKKSMSSKKLAMDRAISQYKNILGLGISNYVTEANHRIGDIYLILSKDLLDSQRPTSLDELALEQYEILLEEQAYPFEEKAIELYESNTDYVKKGLYDNWVKASFKALSSIFPARYRKEEARVGEVSHALQ